MDEDDSPGLSFLVWKECTACLDGGDDLCSCPACNMGETDSCYCENGLPDSEADGVDSDSPDATMIKAVALVAINKALYSVTNLLCAAAPIQKGWLGSTSQDSLDDSDFLWVSNAYKAGKTKSKSAGRKLPIAVHGTVSQAGWMAAWAVLHGSRGGVSLSGGPSKAEMLQKLISRKPQGITVSGDHATRSSMAKAEIELPDFVPINKADTEVRLGIIFGKASVAGVTDREGDVISEEELEKAAYSFMEKANQRATNTHREDIPGKFVASYVEKGEWIVGFKPLDIAVAYAAARGDFVGLSIGGFANRVPIALGSHK